MEKFSEREAARQLRRFDAVWSRVDAARSAAGAAQAAGAELMPRRRKGCRRPPRPGCSRRCI